MPTFMQNYYAPANSTIETADDLYDTKIRPAYHYAQTMHETFELRNRGIKKENCLLGAVVIPVGGFGIQENEEKTLEFHFDSKITHHQWLTIKVDLPDDWECRTREADTTFLLHLVPKAGRKKSI